MQHPTAGAMTVLSPPVKLDGDGFTPPAPRRPSAVRATRSWPISASPRHRSRRSSTRASRSGAGPRIDRRARRLDMIDIRRGPSEHQHPSGCGHAGAWRAAAARSVRCSLAGRNGCVEGCAVGSMRLAYLAIALAAVTLVACSDGEDASPRDAGRDAPASATPTSSATPTASAASTSEPSVLTDLDVLANFAPEFEPARIRRVGEAGDIRLAWTIADMLRFVPPGPSETQRALVAAFSKTDGTTGGSHRLLGRGQQLPDIERHPRTGRVPAVEGHAVHQIRRGVGAVL